MLNSQNSSMDAAASQVPTIIETNEQQSVSLSTTDERPKKRQRIDWIWIKQKKDGKLVFLSEKNLRDLYLLRQLVATPPWEAGYGQIGKAWEDLADALKKHKDDEGAPIYGERVTVKHCKDRFKVLMDFYEKSISDNPFLSGCDDEAPPTEVQTLIEQVHEMYNIHQLEEKDGTEKKRNSAKQNREQAKAILRDAAIGNVNRAEINDLTDGDNGGMTTKNKADKISEETLDLAVLAGCAKQLLSPDSSESIQPDYRNRRIRIQERKLKLEEEEMEMRKADRAQDIEDRKLDREERRQMMENANKMQEALIGIVSKIVDKL